MSSTPAKAKVLIIGGPDVDARLQIMDCLRADFELAAAGSSAELQQRFTAAGFEYHVYPLKRRVNPVSDLSSTYYLWRLYRKVRPQIVHAYDTKPGVWGRLAARLAHVPVIIGTLPGLGSLYADDGKSRRVVRTVYELMQKLACSISDLTIFQNHDDYHQFVDARIVTKSTAVVIPGSGVATDVFARPQVSDTARKALMAQWGIRPDELVVTMITRIIRSKGVLEFAAAARELRARYPDVRFLLVGPEDSDSVGQLTGEELAELKQVVTWPGSSRDIPTVLALSDIFVLPSAYREGIPRVLLEAASMGLPIVTTNSPGCNEVVEHGVNGFLIPIRDATALTKALICLIEQPNLRWHFGKISRQRAVERFDLSVIVEQTRSTYTQLLARKGLLSDSWHSETRNVPFAAPH